MTDATTVILTGDELAELVANDVRKRLSLTGHQVFHIGWLNRGNTTVAVVTVGADEITAAEAHRLAVKAVMP
jgi:hypothetical protein